MSKIDKDKPLPEHTKLRYEECVAKLFLEHYFYNRYGSLEIIDKPDLYSKSNDIGIEVVEAVSPKMKEAEKMWYTMPYLEAEEEKQNHIDRMEELGIKFQSEGVQTWPAQNYTGGVDSSPYDVLWDAMQNKLKRIKSGKYKPCSQYELFIEGYMMPRKEWNNSLMVKIRSLVAEIGYTPARIYLLSQCILQVFDFENNKSDWIDTKNVYGELVCNARSLVEEAEENE